jgi:hypothetical protein
MPILVNSCPRCGAERMTFDVTQALLISIQYKW